MSILCYFSFFCKFAIEAICLDFVCVAIFYFQFFLVNIILIFGEAFLSWYSCSYN